MARHPFLHCFSTVLVALSITPLWSTAVQAIPTAYILPTQPFQSQSGTVMGSFTLEQATPAFSAFSFTTSPSPPFSAAQYDVTDRITENACLPPPFRSCGLGVQDVLTNQRLYLTLTGPVQGGALFAVIREEIPTPGAVPLPPLRFIPSGLVSEDDHHVVPEPSTTALLIIPMLSLLGYLSYRRRHQKANPSSSDKPQAARSPA